MANHFGKLEKFRPDTEAIVSYLERVDLFFVANGIADEKQVAVFCFKYSRRENIFSTSQLAIPSETTTENNGRTH